MWGSPGLWTVRRTYVESARKLGVDQETVRNRINYLRESGILVGWRLLPNPILLGRRIAFVSLELNDDQMKEETISRLKQMDGVVLITNFYGRNLMVSLYDDELGSATKKIALAGIRGEQLDAPGMNMAPSASSLTNTDWQIVRHMLSDAEMNATKIAAEIGVSAKTVNRKLDKMLSTKRYSSCQL